MLFSPDRREWLRLVLAGLAPVGMARGEGGEGLRQIRQADDAGRDSGLAALMATMQRLVAARDAKSLEALMPPEFRVEFDTGKGPQVFHRHWRAESAESGVWPLLGRLLELGGSFCSPTLFALPYVYAKFPVDLDPLAHVVVTREAAPLLAEARSDAAQMTTLDHAIVPLAAALQPPVALPREGFVAVHHPEKGPGFIAAGDVYSPAGHRMFMEKRRGKWVWISLAAATLAEAPDLIRQRRRR